MWPIDKPIPYARNARILSGSAVSKVAASIKEFGWQQPIVVDKEGVIIVGHTRLQAAQLLGLAEVPVHVADNLTPQQVKAYRLADNRVAQESSWDYELLPLELDELKGFDIDISITGFDTVEIEDMSIGGTSIEDYAEETSEATEVEHEEPEPNYIQCPHCQYRFEA
jgi:ParB-like chromosome segregation protein Spo0J